MVRPPCCEKLNAKRRLWSSEEDAKMLEYEHKNEASNSASVPKRAGVRRCGKTSCKFRWTNNYLRSDLKHDNFTPKEEELIVKLHAAIGSRWSIIAQQLPGRTDQDVKNYWNAKLRKKLSEMGIDPVTHKPFSQILADYRNIGGLSKPGIQIASFNNKDLKMLKSQQFSAYSQPQQVSKSSMYSYFKNSDHYSINHSFDLLSQLQAIKFVTKASNCNNNYDIIVSSSSPSSSSSSSSSTICSSVAQENYSSIAFGWNDFLIEDSFLSTDHTQPSQTVCSDEAAFEQSQGPIAINYIISSNNQVEDNKSSRDNSFVQSLLAQDNEMVFEFPNLLEEPMFYH